MKLRLFQREEGFTLVELLVVIGILGILATGLLVAIDPFEQLKKGQDTNSRNLAIEYYLANTRYYASHGDLPWDDGGCVEPTWGTAGVTLDTISTGLAGATGPNCTLALVDEGELKDEFLTEAAARDDVYINSTGKGDLSVCFSPVSKSVYAEDDTMYDTAGADATGAGLSCADKTANAPGDGNCNWCAK